jgi:hypothetical protein
MTNKKTNSRFAILLEPKPKDEPKPKKERNRNEREIKKNNEKERIFKSNNFKKINENEKNLSEDNFPELVVESKNSENNNLPIQKNSISFLDTIKKEIIHEKKNIITPGWVNITFDKKIRKSKFEYGISNNYIINKTQEELVDDVYYALSVLYDKRINDYINLWGYDEYENNFLFPNYDYNYFDKLDEKYYEEEMNNKENENTDNHMFEEYENSDYE